jgi:DNA-3-methyladenine glycosylase I
MKQPIRCKWVNVENPLYVDYHDNEWGRAVHDDIKHFEMITLEGAQAGLSWETILKKRAHYQKVFSGFNPQKVAKYTPAKVEKLLSDPGIIRNRLKVESTISNAKAFINIQKEYGSFDYYIRQFFKKPISSSSAKQALSKAISKDLKRRGFRFVGSTIVYAYMQAVGLINDHDNRCFRR